MCPDWHLYRYNWPEIELKGSDNYIHVLPRCRVVFSILILFFVIYAEVGLVLFVNVTNAIGVILYHSQTTW